MALCGRLGRRLLLLAVVLVALAPTVAARPVSAAPVTQEPSAYIVVDAGTGNVLEGKNIHEPHLTASTVKLLTALVALERLPLGATVPVSARAQSQPASKISMLQGQVWKLNDALHALLMESANDAAFAIAERASGSIEKFAVDAQAVAERLGAKDTTFGDPAGLDDEHSFRGGTKMSAYDLALVARNALAVPEIADTVKSQSYGLTDPAGVARQFENHNAGFLKTYPGAIGMKTGHTDNAGRTLVTAATRNGRTLIGVVLNTWDDTGWSGALLDQGFTMPADAKGVGETLPPVRTATADQRRAALMGMPSALGAAALDGSTAAATADAAPATTPTTAAHRTEPTTRDTKVIAPVGSRLASTSTAASSGSDSMFATIWKAALVVAVVIGLTLFLLRRRAVRRQRARRIARMKRMDEIKRRRMIDLVEPADELGHVRVVTPRTRSAG
jgi:serine-type D-Ala-D-Ala carboxypeptidase (penicillin-binding protein 5/6)